jgi:PBP1b-binding outer membrane lipoprotein LpoB
MKTSMFVVAACSIALAACSAPQINNTRLASSDVVTMTDQMTQSLMARKNVGSRTPGSTPWIVTMDRVINKSNDIIPDGEKWAFVNRLRAQLAQSPAMRERNIQFVVPPAQANELNAREQAGTMRAKPTHALTATFYSITNASRGGRSDAYLCAFQLVDLKDDTIVWEDKYEVKRSVARNAFD